MLSQCNPASTAAAIHCLLLLRSYMLLLVVCWCPAGEYKYGWHALPRAFSRGETRIVSGRASCDYGIRRRSIDAYNVSVARDHSASRRNCCSLLDPCQLVCLRLSLCRGHSITPGVVCSSRTLTCTNLLPLHMFCDVFALMCCPAGPSAAIFYHSAGTIPITHLALSMLCRD
jgi:hypothetical protein